VDGRAKPGHDEGGEGPAMTTEGRGCVPVAGAPAKASSEDDVDGRAKPGHDDGGEGPAMTTEGWAAPGHDDGGRDPAMAIKR
jgi:hypothetical protein